MDDHKLMQVLRTLEAQNMALTFAMQTVLANRNADDATLLSALAKRPMLPHGSDSGAFSMTLSNITSAIRARNSADAKPNEERGQ